MSTGPPPRVPRRRLRRWAWIRLLRPLALTSGVAIVVAFAFIATGGSPSWHVTLRLGLALAALLAAAAAYNDALDAPHDRDVHLWRPIPAGLVRRGDALRVAILLTVAALAIGGSLGWRPFLLVAAGVTTSFLYTEGLKRTPFSWLPFSLAFALVPLWVFESLDRFDSVLWWSFPVGITGGLAFHLAHKLPDYERDDEDGHRNVLHWLTIDYAVPVTWGAFGAYLVVAVASANIENVRVEWLAPTAGLALLAALAVIVLLFLRITERRLLVQRWLLTVGVLIVALGWLGSITP